MSTKAKEIKADIEAQFAGSAVEEQSQTSEEVSTPEVTTASEETPTPEAATPEKEKMVTIILPLTREETGDVYFSVNDRSWLIKRGVAVEVPECVAEVIRNQERGLRKAIDFADSVKFEG